MMNLPWDQWRVRFKSGTFHRWQHGFEHGAAWIDRTVVDHDFWFIAAGQGFIQDTAGQVWPLEHATCVWLRPGLVRRIWCDPQNPLAPRAFHCDLFWPDDRLVAMKHLADVPLIRDTSHLPHFDALTRRMCDLLAYNEQAPPPPLTQRDISHQALSAMLKPLLIDYTLPQALGSMPPVDGSANQTQLNHAQTAWNAMREMHESPESFDMKEFIQRAGYSPNYFRAIFLKITGKTPHQAFIEARVKRAGDLLIHTRHSVCDISRRLQYTNPKYLTDQFKRVVGMSPLAYRKTQNARREIQG